MKNRNTDMAILVLAVTACAIPFLSQPVHMDGGLYMDIARNAQTHPLFPNDMPYMFQGIFWSDLGSHSHGPLLTYFLAMIHHLFGEGPGTEWIYHSFALVFPLLAVLSFYWICALLVHRPLWPAMLLACAPLFLITQHTLMTDLPMLAFWLAAICCFLWAEHLQRRFFYWLSAAFQVAAVLTSFQSLALLPLLGFYHIRKRPRFVEGWVSVAIAPATITSWYVLNCIHYGRPLWEKTLGYMQSRSPLAFDVLWTKLIAILQYEGWLIIFPFFILYVLARDLQWRALLLVLLGSAYTAQFCVPGYAIIEKVIFVIGLTAGVFATLEMAKSGWRAFIGNRRNSGSLDEQFTALWYFGFFAYCFIVLTEGSARYILPMLPPLILVFFRALEQAEVYEYRLPKRALKSATLASGSVVLSLVWGLLLSNADQEFAGIYPRAAEDFRKVAGDLNSYSSGEWGFRYYLGRMGAEALPADSSRVRGGSFIVVPKLAQPNEIPADLRSVLMPVQTFSYKPRSPLRVLDRESHAGFWSTGWGLIPFSFSQQTLEQVDISQVNFMAERLPWARIETASGIQPWPGYATVDGKAPLSVLAKPGTSIQYDYPVTRSTRLELQCGVSPDSYQDGAEGIFEFVVGQRGRNDAVLAESRVAMNPGFRTEDRRWRQIRLDLVPSPDSVLYFRYGSSGSLQAGTGAFAQSLLRPAN